jgi:hypothetical protein
VTVARILQFPSPNPDDNISDEELARIKAHLDGLPAQFWIDLKADLARKRVLMDAMSPEERAAEQKRIQDGWKKGVPEPEEEF